jgi:GNAT superfamily N-acetyltransferase
MASRVELQPALDGSALEEVRNLFLEYAESLGFSLCFQGFDRELALLPGDYAPPRGRLWVALCDGKPAGCVGLRPESGTAAEMKRLFVRPAFRGAKVGGRLARAAIDAARQLGYSSVRLDTIVGKMDAAIAMYEAMGFADIPPYYENPIAGARYLELRL